MFVCNNLSTPLPTAALTPVLTGPVPNPMTNVLMPAHASLTQALFGPAPSLLQSAHVTSDLPDGADNATSEIVLGTSATRTGSN